MMEWTVQCLLFVTLATTSAHNTAHQGISYPQYDDTDRWIQPHIIHFNRDTPPLVLIKEFDHETRINKSPVQRTNERSIAIYSGDQNVQENEKKSVQSKIIDDVQRSATVPYNNKYDLFPNIASRQGEIQDRSGDTVVFPGPTTASSFVIDIPDHCKEIGFCESIPNYPHDIVDDILSKLGEKKEMLYHMDQLDMPIISQRIGPTDTESIEMQLCNSREGIVKPEAAVDMKGDWYIILNKKEKPIQGYRVEICKGEGRSCANNIATFNTGYRGYCKQKYVHRTMTGVDVNKKMLIYDLPVRLPSCCSCVGVPSGRG